MQQNMLIKFSDTSRFMFNQDEVIICNRLNGLWIKTSKECYDILQIGQYYENTVGTLLSSLADDEDRQYIQELISVLDSMGVLFDKAVAREIRDISLSITHRCNLKCAHCMVDATYGGQTDRYDTQTICNILNKIIKVKPAAIVLTGGEPLIRKDFLTILKYARTNYNGKITLMTNGTLFNQKNINIIKELVTNIDISLDGADEESCAIVRGAGVFNEVMKNIMLLKNSGFDKISISMILSENNSYYVDDFFELNKSLGTHPMLRALSYSGRANGNRDILNQKYTSKTTLRKGKKSQNYRTCACTAGYNQLIIEANGNIFPCNLFVNEEFKLANIAEIEDLNQLFDVTKGEFLSPCLQKFEPQKFSKCKNCNINYFCWPCLYAMFDVKDDFDARCKFKKGLYADVWAY